MRILKEIGDCRWALGDWGKVLADEKKRTDFQLEGKGAPAGKPSFFRHESREQTRERIAQGVSSGQVFCRELSKLRVEP